MEFNAKLITELRDQLSKAAQTISCERLDEWLQENLPEGQANTAVLGEHLQGSTVIQTSGGLLTISLHLRVPVAPPKLDPKKRYSFVQYDKYDGEWFTIESNLPAQKALDLWNSHTHNGTAFTKYDDGHYYEITPSPTQK